MSLATSIDTLVVAGLVISGALFIFRGALFGTATGGAVKTANGITNGATPNDVERKKRSRDFVEVMEQTDKNVIVFFGSQTGTAEDYANRLAKEAHKQYGLRCMVADVEDYDMERLDQLPTNHLAIFVVATYGEGEPTDNATDFWNFLIVDSEGDVPAFSRQEEGDAEDVDEDGNPAEDRPIHNLHYAIFGLGNHTYEHYNEVCRLLDARLSELGARRIGERGEGDDDANLEEDFISWKDATWPYIAQFMQVDKQKETAHESAFKIAEMEEGEYDPTVVYHGELVERLSNGVSAPAYDIKHPFIANLCVTRELFTPSAQRHCIHAEVDLRGSGIRYSAGDHLAIWPVNSDWEVERIARACGVANRLDTVVRVTSTDDTLAKKYPFPVPTTYRDIFRHYIDINSCPSREFVAILAQYVQSPEATAYLKRLGSDKDAYHREVLEGHMNLATLVEQATAAGDSSIEITVPVVVAVEGLGRLQPRYYSISSSPKVAPDHAHITAVVVDHEVAHNRRFRGVATNYLHAAHAHLTATGGVAANGSIVDGTTVPPKHYLNVESAVHEDDEKWVDATRPGVLVRVPVFVRPCANFKLPKDTSRPVIMVGPGTGVAPFRGFIQERVHQTRQGSNLGQTVLFYGCRHRDHDFLYNEEWDDYFNELPAGKSELVLAFSREQGQKVYVQDRMQERQADLWRWLHDEHGSFYVCGDAKNMARAVNSQLMLVAQNVGGLTEERAIQWVKDLRSSGRYQEDVWS